MKQSTISMKSLLEAGVHFGHQSTNWNPKMAEYIFVKRKGLHIINLQKTLMASEKAYLYARNVAANNETILFVGTKKQAKQSILEQAKRCHQPYIANRWIGGLLTNFQTIRKSIAYLEHLNLLFDNPEEQKKYTKKELYRLSKKRTKMEDIFGGIKDLKTLPSLVFVIDSHHEHNAVLEAHKKGIPVMALVDTNSDPSVVDVVLPGNDDAIRSVYLFTTHIANAILEGQNILTDNAPQRTNVETDDTSKIQEDVTPKSEEEPIYEAPDRTPDPSNADNVHEETKKEKSNDKTPKSNNADNIHEKTKSKTSDTASEVIKEEALSGKNPVKPKIIKKNITNTTNKKTSDTPSTEPKSDLKPKPK